MQPNRSSPIAINTTQTKIWTVSSLLLSTSNSDTQQVNGTLYWQMDSNCYISPLPGQFVVLTSTSTFQRILLSFRSKEHSTQAGISLMRKKTINCVAMPTAQVLLKLDNFGRETIFSKPRDLQRVMVCFWLESISTCLFMAQAVSSRSFSPPIKSFGLRSSPNIKITCASSICVQYLFRWRASLTRMNSWLKQYYATQLSPPSLQTMWRVVSYLLSPQQFLDYRSMKLAQKVELGLLRYTTSCPSMSAQILCYMMAPVYNLPEGGVSSSTKVAVAISREKWQTLMTLFHRRVILAILLLMSMWHRSNCSISLKLANQQSTLADSFTFPFSRVIYQNLDRFLASIPTNLTPSVAISTLPTDSSSMSISSLSLRPSALIETFLLFSSTLLALKEQANIPLDLSLINTQTICPYFATSEVYTFNPSSKILCFTTSRDSCELQKWQDVEETQLDLLWICASRSPSLVSQTLPEIQQPIFQKGMVKVCLEGTVFISGDGLTWTMVGWMAV